MFDRKIDFLDFSNLKINYSGKLTCRKICKSKYALFVILTIIVIIILSIFSSSKASKANELDKEVENLFRKRQFSLGRQKYLIEQIKTKAGDLKIRKQNQTELNEQFDKTRQNLVDLQSKMNDLKNNYDNILLKFTKQEIEYKDLKEQEEFFNAQVDSLNKEVDALKKEYDRIINDPEKYDNKTLVLDSKVLTKALKNSFESITHGTITKMCYDGTKSGLSQREFYMKCYDNPLLIIVTTSDNEHIAAYADNTGSNEHNFISNLDKALTWWSNVKTRVVGSDGDKIIYFANDIVIKSDGTGYSDFPQSFGDPSSDKNSDFIKNKNFFLSGFEVFTILKKYDE